jgi:hypothetical protein
MAPVENLDVTTPESSRGRHLNWPASIPLSAPFADLEHVTVGVVKVELAADEHAMLSVFLE